MVVGIVVLLAAAGVSAGWLARASAQQRPEYQTQASCHSAGVTSFAGVPTAINSLIAEAARGGWQLVAMTAVSPVTATTQVPGVCVLLAFRRG